MLIEKCVCSSVVERHSDKVEVEGPIPSTRTKSAIKTENNISLFT